jgi:hypothetical protein
MLHEQPDKHFRKLDLELNSNRFRLSVNNAGNGEYKIWENLPHE